MVVIYIYYSGGKIMSKTILSDKYKKGKRI
nr:MAG TPA: hypothetical protein [Caudoviricetes sp.]